MRKCDNCMNSCYAFDCNCGKETLYCKETGDEYEVQPEDVCELHQFVPGYEEEQAFMDYLAMKINWVDFGIEGLEFEEDFLGVGWRLIG